ncbi:MAG: hypothetical protein SF051_04305, partial [Elusimicrobiota bacterium]|nr:hypothetical protein [Elusimicrobiota bacterium]
LTRVAVAGGLHGLRVSGGEAEVRELSLSECDRGVVVAGGALRLDGAGVPVGALEAGPGGRASVGGSATGHAGPGVARRALLAFVVATRDLPGFAAAYAGLYALAARAAVALARRDAALASVLAHRSWATGRWRAGTSDLDLVVVLRGLEGEEGWRRLSALWRGFGRLRRLFPALGELLVLEPEDLAAYLREGGPRGRVVLPAQARVLYGAPLPGVAPGPPPDAFERFGEKAHAYTRLMVRLADSGATPRAAATALASKALEELGVAASPRAPAELRDAGARAMTAFHQEALALLADLGGPTPPEATLTRRAPPPALPGERRRFAAGLETLQARLDGALAAACTDTLYRSYLVLEDEAFEPRRLSVLLERLAGAASPLPAASTVPVVLSWSAWTLWTRLPYLECPHLGAELSGAAPGEAVVARAGRAFAAARRFAWSRRPLPGLRLDPETTARRDRECLATLRATWRFHASPAGGHSPAYALHYLYTRTMGLRLLLERGERVPFFELDEAAARFRVHFPEEMTGWEQRWRAFPARLDAPEMAAHAAWLDRQLRGSSRVPPK